jgi:glucose/arabinose dehydrogenase
MKALLASFTLSSSLFLSSATQFAPAQAQASQEPTQCQTNSAVGALPAMNASNEVELEVVAALPIRPSAVVRTPNGRIIWTEHFGAPNPNKIHELLPDGTFRDYPAGTTYESHSLRIDSKGVLWMLDMGGNGKLPKLVGWDTNTETLVKEIEISSPAYEPILRCKIL